METKALSFTHLHQGVCGRHGTEEQHVTSGELAGSLGVPTAINTNPYTDRSVLLPVLRKRSPVRLTIDS